MPFKKGESRMYLRQVKVVRVGLRAIKIFSQDLKEMKELGK